MRYLPLTPQDRTDMLAKIGVAAVDDLFANVPKDKLLKGPVNLPKARGELEVERILGAMAAENISASEVPFFVGAGAYKHHVPASVDHLIQRSEFLTSYTPYQPEIAQGTLQYLFEFQTQVGMLTGMEVANASMYDGSTGAAEAVLMAHRVTKRRKAILAGNLHPHYRDTIETLSRMASDELISLTPNPDDAGADLKAVAAAIDAETSCIVIQTPDVFGNLHDLTAIAKKAQDAGALLIAVVTEVVSLGAVTPPGAMGADIVVAEGQSIGVGLNFGGPLCRSLRHQAEIRPADARPPLRRDGGRRGQARLRADPLHPRAAHSPREGDVQHLHQFRADVPRLHHPHGAAR
jgi:glycine dehydrogenase subunit 1